MNKKQRQVCWNARDSFFRCLEINNQDVNQCQSFRTEYLASCPKTWIEHFNKKRIAQFKEQKKQSEIVDTSNRRRMESGAGFGNSKSSPGISPPPISNPTRFSKRPPKAPNST